jgi:hypothetical protein
LWIEPRCSVGDQRAVGAHLGHLAARVDQHLARPQQPAFDKLPEGHARLGPFRGQLTSSAEASSARTFDSRFAASARYPASRSIPMKSRPSIFATAPVVPVPKNGSSTTSPGSVVGHQHAMQQRLGLLRRMRLRARRPSDARAPCRSAGTQSERICTPSFSAFSAS